MRASFPSMLRLRSHILERSALIDALRRPAIRTSRSRGLPSSHSHFFTGSSRRPMARAPMLRRMVPIVAVAVVLTLSSSPAPRAGVLRDSAPGPIAAALAEKAQRLQEAAVPPDPARDSLVNGAVAGLVTGAVVGVVTGVKVCESLEILGSLATETRSNCGAGVVITAALFGGLGALIGAGVDALVEQNPRAPPGTVDVRKGVRVRWRF